MNKKIITVTGCLGFIGSNFTKRCLEMGWYVIGIDKIDIVSNINLLSKFKNYKNFKFIEKDVNDLTQINECTHIINFAANSHVEKSLNNSKQFIHDNINGVNNLLELVRHQSPERRPRFIQISTDEVYGDQIRNKILKPGKNPEQIPFTESDRLSPSNVYSATKAAADQLVLAYNKTYGIEYDIIRPTNNYGIYQYTEKLIPLTLKYLSIGKKIPLHDYGKPKRTWIHVDDTIDAILKIIEFPHNNASCMENPDYNRIFNIPGTQEFENWMIVSKIANILQIYPEKKDTQKKENINYEGDYYVDATIKINGNFEEDFKKIQDESTKYNHHNLYLTNNHQRLELLKTNMDNICNFNYHRIGQDKRYFISSEKMENIFKWKTKRNIDNELPSIVEFYRNNFIW